MRLPFPIVAVMFARAPSPGVSFAGVTRHGAAIRELDHGLWVRERDPARHLLYVHGRRDTLSREVFGRGPGRADGELVLAEVPLDCAELQVDALRLRAAHEALAEELSWRGTTPGSLGSGEQVPLDDPEICHLVDRIVAAGPASMLPRPEGAWVLHGGSMLVRWSGWDPSAGWDREACAFDHHLRWRGRQDVWSAGRDWEVEVEQEAGGRVRGRVSATMALSGKSWSFGWLGGTFDVPVCEVEGLPRVQIDARP